MKSIETKYIGPSNTKGSRVSATDCGDHRLTISYNDSLSGDDMHAKAALTLARKLGWKGTLQAGHTKSGMVFVFIDEPRQYTI